MVDEELVELDEELELLAAPVDVDEAAVDVAVVDEADMVEMAVDATVPLLPSACAHSLLAMPFGQQAVMLELPGEQYQPESHELPSEQHVAPAVWL